MKRVLIIILSVFLIVISISSFYGSNLKNEVNAADYTGKITYTSSKPINNVGYLNQFQNDLESVTLSVFDTSERIMIAKVKTSYLSSSTCSTLYNYLIGGWRNFYVPIDFEARFDDFIFYNSVDVLFQVVPTSVVNFGTYLTFNVHFVNFDFGSFVFEGEILDDFLDLFSYKDGYNPTVKFYLNLIDSSFNLSVNWIGINTNLSLVDDGSPFTVLSRVGYVYSNMSLKFDFKLRNSYKVGKIYALYAGVGFHEEDFLYGVTGANLNLSIGVNGGTEIFAYSSGTTKYNFVTGGFNNRHLLLTFDDYVYVNSIQLYLYSKLSSSDVEITNEHFEYCVFLQYLQIFDSNSNVILPPGSNSEAEYKSCQWYDIPCHLGNAMSYFIYDFPVTAPIIQFVTILLGLTELTYNQMLLFTGIGTLFVLVAGIFILIIIVRVLE